MICFLTNAKVLTGTIKYNLVQLLHNKANVNAVNEHGNTPLHYACFWNYDQVAEVCSQILWHLSTLQIITISDLYQELVNKGAIVSMCNKYAETPLDKCKERLALMMKGSRQISFKVSWF